MPSTEQHLYANSRVGIMPTFEQYCPELAGQLTSHLSSVRLEKGLFDNDMPLYLVGTADHVVLPFILNGDNIDNAFTQLSLIGNAFTLNPDIAGPNCKRLTVHSTFMDLRQDQRTRRETAVPNEVAVVKSQYVFTRALASMLRHTAGASGISGVEFHSKYAVDAFEENGLEVMNVTTMKMLVEHIHGLEKQGLLDPSIETNIGTGDFGDLNRAYPLRNITGWDIILVEKIKTISEDGLQRENIHRIVHGDPRGKRIVFVDDITSSGQTDKRSIDLYRATGAKEIIIFTPFPVFVAQYYKTLEEILSYPEVKFFIVTNSIPFKRPSGDRKGIPGVGFPNRKTIEVIDSNKLNEQVIRAIMKTPSLCEAAKLLGENVWIMRDPYEMATELSGTVFKKPEITMIYEGEGKTSPLPQSATIFEEK